MMVNCHSQEGKLFLSRTPCLTAARGAQGGFWLLGKHRMMKVEELLRLQGFNPSQTQLMQVLSMRQAGALIGNSFALPVIGRVLVRALCSIGCSADDRGAGLARVVVALWRIPAPWGPQGVFGDAQRGIHSPGALNLKSSRGRFFRRVCLANAGRHPPRHPP